LNKRPLPDLGHPHPDVAIFSGVVEYVVDLADVLRWLAARVPICVLSYNCVHPDASGLKLAATVKARLASGWLNHFTEQQLIATFHDAGYGFRHRERGPSPYGDENLYRFDVER
jgi:hypothetical protein